MASTAQGLPYPLSNDPVRVNDDLQALAQKVDDLLVVQAAAIAATQKAYYCSLKTTTAQSIPSGVWTDVRFDNENTDPDNWHASLSMASPNSALIIPTVKRVAHLSGMAQYLSGIAGATQFITRFCRDPYGSPDTTGSLEHFPTPGSQFLTNNWQLVAEPGTPLSFQVWHDGSTAITLDLTEFKVYCPVGNYEL